MAQYAYPVTPDVDNAGSWTKSTGGTTDLYSMLDEGATYDDADYIATPKSAAGAVCTLQCGSVTDPAVHTGHVIRIRAKSTATSGGQVTFALYCGTTLIESFVTGVLGTSFAEYSGSITTTNAANITDYSDLHVKLTGVAGSNKYTWVSWVQVEVPSSNITLTVNNCSLSHGATSPTLVQKTLLVVAACAFSLTVDNIALSQKHTLAVNNASLSHTAEKAGLEQNSRSDISENVLKFLKSSTVLVVQDASFSHTASSPTLLQDYQLAVQDASLSHTSDSPTLSQKHTLAVNNASLSHTSDSPTLSQKHTLAPQNASLSHTAENIVLQLPGNTVLSVQDASFSHGATSPTLLIDFLLTVQNAALSHGASTPTLSQKHTLAVQDASLSHTVGNITLIYGSVTLVVQNAVLSHLVESPTLLQKHTLAMQDAVLSLTVTSPTLHSEYWQKVNVYVRISV